MNFVRENGGVLALMGVAFVVLGAFADWRIAVKVDEALADKGFATSDKIAALEAKDAEMKETHDKDTDEWKRRVERIVEILLEE